MSHLQNSAACSPFFRFALRYPMSLNEVHGPRISYIQSVYLIEAGEGRLRYQDNAVDLYPGVHIYLPSGKYHKWESGNASPIIFRCVFFEWNYRIRPGIQFRNDYLPNQGTSVIEDYIEPPFPYPISEYTVLQNTKDWNRLYNTMTSNTNVYDTSHFPASLRIQGNFQFFLDHLLNQISPSNTFSDPRIHKS